MRSFEIFRGVINFFSTSFERSLIFICVMYTTTAFGYMPTSQLNLQGITSQKPSVSINRIGVSVAVWEEKGLPTSIIKSAILPPGATTWVPLGNLADAGVSDRALPQVGHDNAGNAIAIWYEQEGDNYLIRSAQLKHGSHDWIPLGNVSPISMTSKEQHQLAVDSLGNAVVVWIEYSEGLNKLFGSKLVAGSTDWTLSPLPISLPGFNATSPAVAMGGKGASVVVWRSFQKGTNIIAGALLPPNSITWTATDLPGSDEPPQFPHVAMNEAGNAIAVWAEGQKKKLKVRAAKLSVGGTNWVLTSNISASLTLDQQLPKVAVDRKGNAIVNYIGFNGLQQVLRAAVLPQGASIWRKTYEASILAEKIIPESIVVDALGNATAVFQALKDNHYVVKSSSLPKGSSTWIFANDLSAASTQKLHVGIAINHAGSSVAVWDRMSQGTINIEGNAHFSAYPPESFSGTQEVSSLLRKKNLVNVLTWKAPSLGTPPFQYKIFRDAALTNEVAVVPGVAPLIFKDLDRKSKSYTYYIVSEDAFGGRSSPSCVTVEPHTKNKKN